MKKHFIVYLFLAWFPTWFYAQGTWNPPGLDPSFPRTLLDSLSVPTVRATLSDPEQLSLYGSTWLNAKSEIPAGNTTISERSTRARISREAAFVFLMDRGFSSGSIVPLSQNGRDSLQVRVLQLLEQMNTEVDVGTFWTFYTPWQHRSKELIDYLIAYDLLKGAGVSTVQLEASKMNLLTFAANLYQKSMASYTLLNLRFFTYQFNNHSIMTASALGLAAVVFNDQSSPNVNYQPLNWINAGLYNVDNTLWMENGTYPRVSEPDTLAGYAEGPNYFKYGFENAFPFIRSMGNFLPDGYYPATFNSTTRSIRNLWFDPRYDRLYDWMNRIRMPDGGCPSIHDSYMGYGTVIMALSGKPQFNLVNPAFTPDDASFRTQYIATNVAHGSISDSLFQSMPAAGSLVFRSSWDVSAVYMHFIGKHGIALTGAKSHHQGDASSFSLMAYGELLAVDPGYPGASLAELENKAVDHSLILVNGNGPLPPTGEFVSTSTNTAYIEHCFDTPFLDYGEVRVAYQGANIVRKSMFVRNKYVLLADFISSASPQSYTWQLHGNGLFGSPAVSPAGAFVPDFSNLRATYSRNSVTLLARVACPGSIPVFSYDQDSMVINGGFRKYSRMLVQKNNVTGTLFLATLYPYASPAPLVLPSSQSSTLTSARISADGFNDLIFCSQTGVLYTVPADSSGMDVPVKGNGKINFMSETTGGSFASAFVQSGDSIVAGTQTILRTDKKMDVAWMQIDSSLFAGYVSDFGVVKIFSAKELQPLTGLVTAAAYDTIHHLNELTFSGKCSFYMGSPDLTWVWSGTVSSDWHNPSNWKMLDHGFIHGVPSSTNNVIIPHDAGHMPVVTSVTPATCHNLVIQADASLTIALLKFLTVTGTLTMSAGPGGQQN